MYSHNSKYTYTIIRLKIKYATKYNDIYMIINVKIGISLRNKRLSINNNKK